MKIELRWCALFWICLSTVVWGQEGVPEQEDVPTFLREMERKAGEVSSSEAKWVRKTFAPSFGEEGEGRQQELIATVRFLEEQRSRFSTAILGYLRGAHWLVAHQEGKRWNDWHRQSTISNRIQVEKRRKRTSHTLRHCSRQACCVRRLRPRGTCAEGASI